MSDANHFVPSGGAGAGALTGRPEGNGGPSFVPWSPAAWLRVAWAIFTAFVVQSVALGLAALPAVAFWEWHFRWDITPWGLRVTILAMSFVPAYLLFAFALMALSAWSARLLRWRPQPGLELRIEALDWPLLDWMRYAVLTHIVRVLCGTFLRATPVWNWYMRMNGARIGRRVWVNSLDVADHCLLDFGDDVVIGGGAHLSGHTVERGVLRTARVKLARGVVVGVSANIEIGVEAGPGCQIGALSEVPKYARLDAHSTYVGAPVRKLEGRSRPEDPKP